MRYLYDKYWDFYDHFIPLSHVSLAEGLLLNGFAVEEVIDRFLPLYDTVAAAFLGRACAPLSRVALGLALPWKTVPRHRA